MIFVYRLGIFTDFFDWVKEVVSTVFNHFQNAFNGTLAIYNLVIGIYDFMVTITAYLPAVLSALIVLGFTCLIVKFVINR